MKPEILPFDESMLVQAAGLLAQRHAADCTSLPGLPAGFDQPLTAHPALSAAWRKPGTSGTAAFQAGELVGYLLGEPRADTLRGRHVWMHPAGHALQAAVDSELLRDLYAAAAPTWVAQGYFDHYVLTPASGPDRLDPWLRLGFSFEQVHALLALDERTAPDTAATRPAATGPAAGLEIRPANPEDAPLLASVSGWIRHFQSGAPCWGPALPEDEAEIRQGYAELASEPEARIWLAFRAQQVVGFQVYTPAPGSDTDLLTPPNCIELKVAATHPEARGQGIGRALTQHTLAAVRRAGYRWCSTDWRITNLTSSRFWPAQGFRPLAHRLVRRIDERVAWAR